MKDKNKSRSCKREINVVIQKNYIRFLFRMNVCDIVKYRIVFFRTCDIRKSSIHGGKTHIELSVSILTRANNYH